MVPELRAKIRVSVWQDKADEMAWVKGFRDLLRRRQKLTTTESSARVALKSVRSIVVPAKKGSFDCVFWVLDV